MRPEEEPEGRPGPSDGTVPFFITHENLFSEHYLLNVLPESPEWESLVTLAGRVRDKVHRLLRRQETFEELTELDLDREFFDPIFKELGHVSHIQVRTEAGNFPDYVFFENELVKTRAEKHLAADRRQFFRHACALGELKAWDVHLDGGRSRRALALDPSHPTGQLYGYMIRNELRWGILTNGRKWRIYHYDGAWPRVGRYYEIDLPHLAQERDVRAFIYFVYFFRREAFVADSSGRTPLDRAREGTVEYSQALAEDLKEAVYRALGILANGFLRWSPNRLDGSAAVDREAIHEASMRLLYRILFVLKAESIGLLPLDNPIYRSQRSFDRIKREIRDRRLNAANPVLNDSDDYYVALKRLFRLIDEGSRAHEGTDVLQIPPYNGGLFRQTDPRTNERDFLAAKSIGDADLAEAIDLLARHTGRQIPENLEEAGFVDYSSLEAAQLGTLYEGLLEYQLGYADGEDYVAFGEKETWIPASEHTGTRVTRPDQRASAGTFFLRTDKGERHATGSYYTPDFIVRNIIQKTVGPVLQERLRETRRRGGKLRDAVLSLRIMDPAMGSGHFLVEIVDYLTPALINAVDEDRVANRLAADYEISTDEARREIVSHCVYGVDINPMAVELTKVTLWLHTLSRGRPLTFLDHRLKTGDSLLGANIRRLSRYPDKKTRGKWAAEVAKAREQRAEQRFTDPATFPPLFLERIIGRINEIDALRDETVDDVKQKEKLYEGLRQSPEFRKIRAIADAWMAAYFDVYASRDSSGSQAGKNFSELQWSLHQSASEEEWRRKANAANLEAIRRLAERRSFFHWELEFPEIFFEGGVLRDNDGFDAIIGNPPYLSIVTLYGVDRDLPDVYTQIYESGGAGRYDIYVLFVERSFSLLNSRGEFGFILPNKWFKGEFGRPLRGLLSRRQAVREIVDWRNYYNIFRVNGEGPITFVSLLFLSRTEQAAFRYVGFPGLRASTDRAVAASKLEVADRVSEERTPDLVVGTIPAKRLTDTPWSFATGDVHALLTRLKRLPSFGKEADVFEGVTTAAVPVFVLQRATYDSHQGTYRAWSPAIGGSVTVEEEIVRHVLKGRDVTRWRILYDEDIILWPYDQIQGARGKPTVALMSAERLSRDFPKAWDYLNHPTVKGILQNREPRKIRDPETGKIRKKGRFEGKPDWFSFSYPKSMTRFESKKLVLPDAASQGDAAWDSVGVVVLDTAYGVVPKEGSKWDIHALQAVLNNSLLTLFVREMGSPLKDGFFRFKTKYVEPYPIPRINWATSPRDRSSYLEEARGHISRLEEGEQADPTLVWVRSRVTVGQLDVLHDFLTLLASRIDVLYSQNLEETKAFLKWVQRSFIRSGARIEDFAGKTKLQRYAEFPFEEIFQVLKKNKKHLDVNPRDRQFHDEFERAYNKSVRYQRSRFEAAKSLEPVVEEVVYLMYGLTEEERAVVDEAEAAVQYR